MVSALKVTSSLETVISVVTKIIGDYVSLDVERRAVETVAFAHHEVEAVAHDQFLQGVVGELILDIFNHVRLSWIEMIVHRHFPLSVVGYGVHRH